MLAAFWAGIPLQVTQEASVVPRLKRATIRTPFQSLRMTRRETGRILPRIILMFFLLAKKNSGSSMHIFAILEYRIHINSSLSDMLILKGICQNSRFHFEYEPIEILFGAYSKGNAYSYFIHIHTFEYEQSEIPFGNCRLYSEIQKGTCLLEFRFESKQK